MRSCHFRAVRCRRAELSKPMPDRAEHRDQIVVAGDDLDAALAFYEGLGFRLDMISPADAPRVALVSGHGVSVRIECSHDNASPVLPVQAGSRAPWVKGRAGMEYRDLIPDRCGGRFIASHIRIR